MTKGCRSSACLHAIILTVLGAVLLCISWNKWANMMVDYGRELYTPWRITCGEVLYKDLASLFGPVSSYWNAFLFKIFGPYIMTLVVFNILLVAGITILIYRFFSRTTDKWIAFIAGAAFLSMFAFTQRFGDQGNHAYICPYTYSVTYAMFLSLWTMDVFAAYVRSGKDRSLWAVGILIGLIALCRFEVFMILAPSIVLGLVVRGRIDRWALNRFFGVGAMVLGGFFIPVAIAYFYFAAQLPQSEVWPSILGYNSHWVEIFNNRYYSHASGLDYPWQNFKETLASGASYIAVIMMLRWLCLGIDCLEKNNRTRGVFFILLSLMGIDFAAMFFFVFNFGRVFQGFPAALIFMAGCLAYSLIGHRHDVKQVSRQLPLLVMAVWGLLMLGKVILNVQIYDLGFVYTLPATLLFVVLCIGWLPDLLGRVYGRAIFVKTVTSLLIGFVFLTALKYSVPVYWGRNVRVEAGRDVMDCSISPYSAPGVNSILAFLNYAEHTMGKDARFVPFPEGIMLNFLTKTKNPMPYLTFLPAEMIAFGEQEILRSFKEHRPEYIVLNNRMLKSFGYFGLGSDYARSIMGWIIAHYRVVWRSPSDNGFKLTVLKWSDDQN